MLSAFTRALAQLLDPAIFWVLILSVLGAVLVQLGCWFGVGEVLAHIRMFQNGWLEWLARIAIAAGTVFGTVALFGVLMAAIAGLFVDRVARAAHAVHPNQIVVDEDRRLFERALVGEHKGL